jgi:Pyruvate/2-oxoglutarate dehydrogenase complex, dihydrolipoamide dehydrogenase (E3) component, and related enzymes
MVTRTDGSTELLGAKEIVIATGSRPYHPPNVPFEHSRVYDSDSILSLEHTPKKLIIYGAGVIGCEYASIFSGLGIKVELINSFENLLAFLDDEISVALDYHLRESGVMVRHREVYSKVEASTEGVALASGIR